MEDIIKELGFESTEEWQTLVADADISSPEKLEAFNEWKFNDGTKEGLLKLQPEK